MASLTDALHANQDKIKAATSQVKAIDTGKALIQQSAEDAQEAAIDAFIDKPVEFLFGNTGTQNLSIDTYRSKFLGSNARAYLFLCKVQFPGMQNAALSGVTSAISDPGAMAEMVKNGLMSAASTAINVGTTSLGTSDFKYFVKSTSLPESMLEEASTFWAGQQYKMSSVRRSQDWTVTFLINDDANVVRKFWEWHLMMHNPELNMYGSPKDYMADQVVQLLGLDGYPICTYKLFGAWPKSIGQVDLDYTSNEFATVDITFTYQYHTVTQTEEVGASAVGRKLGAGAVRNFLG